MRIKKYDFNYGRRMLMEKAAKGVSTAGVLAPLWPMIQGGVVDGKELMSLFADNLDLPEIKNLFKTMFQAEQSEGGGGRPQLGGDQNSIRSPASTSREVVRRNVPTGGTAGNRMMMTAQAMGGAGRQANSQQMASMGRPGA